MRAVHVWNLGSSQGLSSRKSQHELFEVVNSLEVLCGRQKSVNAEQNSFFKEWISRMIFGSLYENYSNIDLEMVNEYKQQVGLISSRLHQKCSSLSSHVLLPMMFHQVALHSALHVCAFTWNYSLAESSWKLQRNKNSRLHCTDYSHKDVVW